MLILRPNVSRVIYASSAQPQHVMTKWPQLITSRLSCLSLPSYKTSSVCVLKYKRNLSSLTLCNTVIFAYTGVESHGFLRQARPSRGCGLFRMCLLISWKTTSKMMTRIVSVSMIACWKTRRHCDVNAKKTRGL